MDSQRQTPQRVNIKYFLSLVGLSEEKSSEKSTKCNITLRNSTDSKPHSLFNNKSSIFTDKENLQKILILKLLEKNIIADMYQNAVLNLLDSKINADLMREIDLQEITNYFEEVEDKLISKKKQRDEVGLKIRCKKSKGKLRSLKSAN